MYLFFSRWPQAVAALVIVALFATSTQAFAQSGQPGEDNHYSNEQLFSANPDDHGWTPLRTQTDYSEARNRGGLVLRVWRANTSTNVAAPVWAAWGGGSPFMLGNTATYVNPVVVPYLNDYWMVFHTGTDGGIYYTIVESPTPYLDNATWAGRWARVPYNQTTNMAVSAVQYRTTSGAIFIAYRGSGNDSRVFGTWLDSSGWGGVELIGNGLLVSSPSVTYNPVTDRLWVTGSGLDNAVWYTHQRVGDLSWPNWSNANVDRLTQAPPQIAAGSDGRMTVSLVDTAGHPNYRTFDQNMNPLTDWTVDTSGWTTRDAVQLVAIGVAIFSLFIGNDNTAYWKHLRN